MCSAVKRNIKPTTKSFFPVINWILRNICLLGENVIKPLYTDQCVIERTFTSSRRESDGSVILELIRKLKGNMFEW